MGEAGKGGMAVGAPPLAPLPVHAFGLLHAASSSTAPWEKGLERVSLAPYINPPGMYGSGGGTGKGPSDDWVALHGSCPLERRPPPPGQPGPASVVAVVNQIRYHKIIKYYNKTGFSPSVIGVNQ